MENYLKESHIEKNELISLLNQYGIPIHDWGKGEAKTVDHLVNEINNGETMLVQDVESGKLIREFSFLALLVLYKDRNDTYKLVEEKQVFADGRERVRSLEVSIGEKIKRSENNIEDVVARALSEELGIQEGFVTEKGEVVVEDADSKSYPGLTSHRNKHNAVVEIDSTQYNPGGYKEVQADKTTYFTWKKIA